MICIQERSITKETLIKVAVLNTQNDGQGFSGGLLYHTQ